MVTRRDFFKTGGLAATGIALGTNIFTSSAMASQSYVSKRPVVAKRKFTSVAVEDTIKSIKPRISDPKLAWMFENCFPNTLDTTVEFKMEGNKPDTFVITGDIHAMWLRDSSAQVWPYLSLARKDDKLKKMIAGLIHRQSKSINFDPYANAYNDGPIGSEWESDKTDMKPELHERKWEIDSLCYPIRLSYNYWKITGDTSVFDDEWRKAMALVYQTFIEQQRKNNKGPYSFQRVTDRQGDTVLNDGWGSPVKPVGLIYSSFRPSDDATLFGFLVPSNFFAVTSLTQLAEISNSVTKDAGFARKCTDLANEVRNALQQYAVVNHAKYGKVYAFEVDGFGNYVCMDDANVPSLLALPYLGACPVSDPVYQNTRKLVLSEDNPYFFKGTAGEGIGGPHIGYDYIWPMSIIMRAMTSTDQDEIKYCITMLRDTDGGTGFMHESFYKDDATKFTRSWFAWVNTLFGELMIRTVNEGKVKI